MKITLKDLKESIRDSVKEEVGAFRKEVDAKFKETDERIGKGQEQLQDLESRQGKLIPDGEEDMEAKRALEDKAEEKKFKLPHVKRKFDRSGLPLDQFSFARFVVGCKRGNFTGFEKEVLEESAKLRALGSDTGTTDGGYFIAEEYLPQEFIANYRAAQICRAAGMRVLPCSGTPVKIPKTTDSVTVSWTGENADIAKSDVEPAQLELSPKQATARSQISKLLLRTSAGTAENIIRQDMAEGLGLAIDLAVMQGTGSSNQPTGMSQTSGINTVSASSGALTMAMLMNMEYELLLDNCKFRKPAFLMHPRTWNAIRQMLINSETNHYLINPGKQDAARKELLGYPVFLSTQITINGGTGTNEANVFLADMNDVVLAEWFGIELDATDVGGDAWKQNAYEVRGVATVDVGLRNPESVCLISDTTS